MCVCVNVCVSVYIGDFYNKILIKMHFSKQGIFFLNLNGYQGFLKTHSVKSSPLNFVFYPHGHPWCQGFITVAALPFVLLADIEFS